MHDNELTHFGVKGMRWGVRRKKVMDRIATRRSEQLGISKEEYESRMRNTTSKDLKQRHTRQMAKGAMAGVAYKVLGSYATGTGHKYIGKALNSLGSARIAYGVISGISERRYVRSQEYVDRVLGANNQ